MNITILGSGTFGIALANCFSNNNITIWSKFQEEINNLKNKYKNFTFTTNIKESIEKSNIIIIAIPIEFIQETIKNIKPYYKNQIILIASKGIETKTSKFAYQMLEETLPNIPYGILSGGTFAKDMMENKIMGITLATTSKEVITLKKHLNNNNLKIEITNDIIGTSICGAIKNIIAIGFGILDGANYPESSKFLYLTESIIEIKNLIKKLGGNSNTIFTYAGLDDIMMTSTSQKSRNYTLGTMIGKELSQEKIEEYKQNTTIEGLKTTLATTKLLKEKNIKSPIINTIYKILYNKKSPQELIIYLKNMPK